MRIIFINAQKPPKTHPWPICSEYRTFWYHKNVFGCFSRAQSCQNQLFCTFLIFGFPGLQITFFMVQMGPDGFRWRGMVHFQSLKCRRGQIWSNMPIVLCQKNQLWREGRCLWGPISKMKCQKILPKPIFFKILYI